MPNPPEVTVPRTKDMSKGRNVNSLKQSVNSLIEYFEAVKETEQMPAELRDTPNSFLAKCKYLETLISTRLQ